MNRHPVQRIQTRPPQHVPAPVAGGKPPPREKPAALVLLEQRKAAIQERLGNSLDARQLISMLATMMSGRGNKLAVCTPASILGFTFQCAQLDLKPDRVLGEAYPIPFKNGVLSKEYGRDVYEAQFVLGYRGILKLVMRSGFVRAVVPRIVYANDLFRPKFGTAEVLVHEPADLDDRGAPKAVYATMWTEHRGFPGEPIPWSEIAALQKRQQTRPDSPWRTHPKPMALKTAIRRSVKYFPLDPHSNVDRALQLDELAEECDEPMQDMADLGRELLGADEAELDEHFGSLGRHDDEPLGDDARDNVHAFDDIDR